MKFLYPAGLWALLGIPLLILLYLFKPKHDERAVSSTFLWKLSWQFRKKQLPLQRLKKILVFVLQLLMIILGSLLIAQPKIALTGAGVEYIAILDVSGSMRMADETGVPRFDTARQAILDDAARLGFGSVMTVLTTDAKAAWLTERTQSYGEVERAVNRAACGYGTGDVPGALAAVQDLVWARPDAMVYLYTDKDYAQTEGVTVVNIAKGDEWNAAITGLAATLSAQGTVFESTLVSYGRDASLTMALYVDDALKTAKNVECPAGQPVTVTWEVDQYCIGRARVMIEAADSLAEDNEYWLFTRPADSISVLLVSGRPFYLRSALAAFPAVNLKETRSLQDAESSGYDIYIYDGFLPETLPEDGAVWLVNPPAAPGGTGIVLGDALRGAPLSASRVFPDDAYGILTQNLLCKDVSVLRFREAVSTGNFVPVLFCGELPVMLAGRSEMGSRRLVLLFDLHDSNLPLLTDYVFLIGNMLDFSMPAMLDAQEFDSGADITATVLPLCEEMFVHTPTDGVLRIPFDAAHAVFGVAQPGAHTLLQKRSNGLSQYLDFYVRLPLAESNPGPMTEPQRLAFSVAPAASGEAMAQADGEEGYFDPLPLLAALLVLILIVECVVVNHEQF